MTETQRAAMQQALAFTMREFATVRDFEAARAMVHDALEAALAEPEPEPEPVARATVSSNVPGRIDELDVLKVLPRGEHLLYTTPPARRPLTDAEIDQIADSVNPSTPLQIGKRLFARAVERAHGITGGNDE